MTSNSHAFRANSIEITKGLSNIPPANNSYGVNATPENINPANDAQSLSVAMNAASGISWMLASSANNANIVGSAFLVGGTLSDPGEGIRAKSANVISPDMPKPDGVAYVVGSALTTMSDFLGLPRPKEPEMEMTAAAPQPPKFQPGVFGL